MFAFEATKLKEENPTRNGKRADVTSTELGNHNLEGKKRPRCKN